MIEIKHNEKISGTKRRKSFTQEQLDAKKERNHIKDFRAKKETLIEYQSESKDIISYLQEDTNQSTGGEDESKGVILFTDGADAIDGVGEPQIETVNDLLDLD